MMSHGHCCLCKARVRLTCQAMMSPGPCCLWQMRCVENDLPTSVAIDDGLDDGHHLAQFAKSVKLPLLFSDGHVDLAGTFQRQPFS